MNILFILVSILALFDRFFLGDSITRRKKKTDKLLSSVWTMKFGRAITDVLWMITARMIIVGTNFSLWTVMWCTSNFIQERFRFKYCLNIDVRRAHYDMHRRIGIWVHGVGTVLHVLLIFLPPLIDKGSKLYYYETLEYNWKVFCDPTVYRYNGAKVPNMNENGVYVMFDEVFRVITTLTVFWVLFPLSRSNKFLRFSYNLAMLAHILATLIFIINSL